ncbi:MAG: glycosyltransferase family 2 protein, partial [Planctomycetaceae bacterium]
MGRQTYGHWDALYLDSVSEGTVRQALRETADDYVGFVRMGDTLSHEALYEFAMRVLEDPGHRPDVLYCDEDHLEADGRTRVRPIFKPAWSPEMLLGYDYMGRLTLVRRELMEHVGGIGPGIDEAAHWDLKLRLACRTDRIVRIPECLYHNRCDLDVRETYRAGPAGRDVLKAHLNRLGLDGVDAIEQPNGTFRVRWTLPDYPLVSIIIPTVDQPRLIRRCVAGLLSGTSYPKKEIILVDNGSTDPETLALYEGWKASGTVEVIPFDHPFNYSAACNVGAAAARGDYLLFFNNDIEISSSDWLEEMMRWAQLPGVGIVGPKMIFPDGRVNHAGIAVTRDSFANLYWGDAGDYWSIFGHVNSYRNYSGLLGACQLMSRSTFEGLGGYDERFLLVCSDIDLCLKARQSGFRLVYDPHAVLIHHESTTRRGIGDPIDDLNLASREIIRLGYLEDPYYHPSLAPCKTMPELRPSYEPSSSAYFGWLFSEKNPGILRDLDLDLYDEGSVRDIAGRWSSGCFPGDWSPVKVDSDAETAACFVLDLLRKDSALRRTFPRALAEGLEGAYCRWLCSEAVTRYGLPSSACDMIRNVFQSRPSARIRQIYELTDDLQRTYPRAYLRAGRARFFRWLLAEGRKQYGITNAAIWWFLIECDEDPAGELSRTYRISPVWQRFFPDAYTPVGRGRFARWLYDRHGIDATGFGDSGHPDLGPLEGLRLAYGCRGEWKRRFPGALRTASETRELAAWLRDREGSDPRVDAWLLQIEAEVDRGGLDRLEMNVLGHFCYPSGLQASTLAYLDSLKSAGVVTSCRDVPASLEHDEPDRDAYLGLEAYDVSLIHVQPEPYLPVAYDRARLASRRGVYRVAMWVCETDSIPEEWRSVSRLVNEVWTMSRFVAEGLRRLLLDVPVHHLTPGLRIGPIGRIRRDRYGIALDRFIFHFMFDMNSTLERKNPLGVIAA